MSIRLQLSEQYPVLRVHIYLGWIKNASTQFCAYKMKHVLTLWGILAILCYNSLQSNHNRITAFYFSGVLSCDTQLTLFIRT
jgi:hypothetical protein